MATTHTITDNTYSGKKAAGYLSAALLSGKTLSAGVVDIRDNIQGKEVIQVINSDANLIKNATCDFTDTGTLTTTEIVLQPEEFQVNLQFCAKEYRTTWESLQMKGVKSGIAKDLSDFILEHVVQKVAANMETNFWQGATATEGMTNGVSVLAGADSDVVDVTGTTLTSANIVAEMGKLITDCPSTIYGKDDLYLYASTEAFKSYVSALGGFAASGLGAAGIKDEGPTWFRGQQELYFEGVKVFHAPGMAANEMILTRKSNLIFSTSLFSENNQASIIDMSKYDGSLNTRVILRGSQGVNIANGAEIVYYT
tara:strand:- start:596 stop:1528 length:933 start_codon:yes stop_codon:yes gene_type:complete